MTRHLLLLLIVTTIFQSCSPQTENKEHVYYIIKHPDTTANFGDDPPPPTPPPAPFYGQLNFILLDTSIFLHKNYYSPDFSWCGTGKDFSKPPFLHLAPDSLVEIKANELENILAASIPDSIDSYGEWNPFFPCISSPTDSIKNKAFKTLTDSFKRKKVKAYNIRIWTEEERYVTLAKINHKPYDRNSVDWKVGFTQPFNPIETIKFIPPKIDTTGNK